MNNKWIWDDSLKKKESIETSQGADARVRYKMLTRDGGRKSKRSKKCKRHGEKGLTDRILE